MANPIDSSVATRKGSAVSEPSSEVEEPREEAKIAESTARSEEDWHATAAADIRNRFREAGHRVPPSFAEKTVAAMEPDAARNPVARQEFVGKTIDAMRVVDNWDRAIESAARGEQPTNSRESVPPAAEAQETVQEPQSKQEWQGAAIEDMRAAFKDYNIPEKHAELAVEVSGSAARYADFRESFTSSILDKKADLDEVVEEHVGHVATVRGVNDWETAIDYAANSRSVKPVAEEHEAAINQFIENERNINVDSRDRSPDVTASDVRSAIQQANQQSASYRRQEPADIMAKYPNISNEEAAKIGRTAERSVWLRSKLPESWQRNLGLNVEEKYASSLDRAYNATIDKKADSLLAQRSEALKTLRGVDPNAAPHLLPSKQYRSAESLTRIDQQLRQLRPLKGEEYGTAMRAANGQELRPQINASQVPSRSVDPARNQPAVSPQATVSPVEKQPAAVASGPTRHQEALQEVRAIQQQTPTENYRSRAAESMANRIIQQLQEGRETVRLSSTYRGDDQGRANSTHQNAVEANADIIQAVRDKGIPVDTGTASIVVAKKSEVELGNQVEHDQSI